MAFKKLIKKPKVIEVEREHILRAIEQYLWSIRAIKENDTVNNVTMALPNLTLVELRREV